MKLSFLSFLAATVASSSCDAFVVRQQHQLKRAATMMASASDDTQVDMGLTPELQKITDAFQMIPSEELRYKQLLYMATNTEKANGLDDASKIPENKVPGCLSTVYIDGSAKFDKEAGDYVIDLVGDSDGLLTRGLVALLVRGVSGNTAADIQKINPEFIKLAGISQSLTPGRNNGFLNMVAVIKRKALELDAIAREAGDSAPGDSVLEADEEENATGDDADASSTYDDTKGPKYNAIVSALQVLKPTSLELTDNSHQHAGHAGNDMDGESHFELEIVAEAFEGLSLVKRHKLVYMTLSGIMDEIHALQIRADTPQEVAE
mmetsp:Transcript_15520/g.43588  ORF Transcript_15520/g.43588 Transcript_15520/m.43588 type:complete len:320 (+) Transcript_15520:37-996(+)|eukprot:CAMPEP_0119560878 /NCGR_PEP_ID=MMETSP1352-20130426/16100_1 /TAXON_ID=265584 /ORGANISM="Stauroneis constricta, Strain CCMP1120" /LENGTH=319 /DNA_ID=CAMNT_0007608945 /DNA_START=62 /DNA_END=1021 /DNA_ORIENTATION=-